ncbi:hypothetical protein WEI85_43010 [Actinomycetes bacterium KLBMP 9797]
MQNPEVTMGPAGILAMNAVNDHVLSARPHAPVVPEPPRRPARAAPVRRATALVLRRLADRVEPACSPLPSSCPPPS